MTSTSPPAALALEPAKSKQFPVNGIHIDYLRTLLLNNPEMETWTMADVCDKFVKPMTKTMSLIEHLLDDPSTSQFVSEKAGVFVSYVWSTLFDDLLDALRNYSGFVWIDLFILNQNKHETMTSDELQNVFGEAGKVQCVLL